MRKLTPYDDVSCFCKTPLQVTTVERGGQEVMGAQNCECVAFVPAGASPITLGAKSLAQYRAIEAAQKLKLTKFKVRGIMVSPVKTMTVVRT